MANELQSAERAWARTRAKREFWLGVARKLASWRILRIKSGHYYSPVPSIKEIERDAPRIFDQSLRNLPGISLNEADQLAFLARLATFYHEQPFSESPRDGIRYYFDNYWYGRADALFLYAIIRLFRPSRIVEIGSGFSSAVMLDTNERFLDRTMHLSFIEPDSLRLRKLLRQEDYGQVAIVEQRIQEVDPAIVDPLAAGDILFIDSSHVSKVGSDLNHILFELLPRLAPGVLIHFHDVRYPFEYPRDWLALGISWNEAYMLRAFLQYNTQFPIQFWNDFVMKFHADALREMMPLCVDAPAFGLGGSLWLQRAQSAEPSPQPGGLQGEI